MADPISAGLLIAGTALKVHGQISAGVHNKRVAYARAQEEERAGSQKELQIRAVARKAIGEQVAAQASNGFLGDTGSALEALAESQINRESDVLNVRREAMGRAQSLRAEGDYAKRTAFMDAAGTIIGAAQQGYKMQSDWSAAKANG